MSNRQPATTRRLSMLRRTIAVGALAVCLLACAGDTTDPGRLERLSADGLKQWLSAHRGEVIVINLWATWCRPCLEEIPELVRLAEAYAGEGVVVVGIAMDDPADLDSVVAPFKAKWFPGFRSFMRDELEFDTLVSVLDPTWNEILPTSYLLNRSGQLAGTLAGGKSYEEFEALIKPLL